MWLSKLSIVLLFLYLHCSLQTSAHGTKKSYIVYMGSHSHGNSQVDIDLVKKSHHGFLSSFLGNKKKARDAIIYSYTRHINGFAAFLDDDEATAVAKHPDVVSVFLNNGKKLHTTHSWDFMLLEKTGSIHSHSLWKKARFGEDTIIANLDTGVWPESESFSDQGFGPIPSHWKGVCENNTQSEVPCNRKLIGASYYNKGHAAHAGSMKADENSARDLAGHGTHTLSTAGGNFVRGANVFGLGNGTAKGGSPKARVASYKVCWTPINGTQCFEADILSAFDQAIHDGVDVISLSLGEDPVDYFNDGISIGAFHAVNNGIVVVCSAGNSGPRLGTASNIAPWMITVGASSLDREFQTFVELPNGQRFKGTSFSMPMPEQKFYPLMKASAAKYDNVPEGDAMVCKPNSLDPEKAEGKILACLRGETARVDKGVQAALAGAVGMILCNDEMSGNDIIADPHFLPASHITYKDSLALFAYIDSSTSEPLAYISKPTAAIGIKPAPTMAAFSSRGPNSINPEILKPDITAPGVNIIAAYSEALSPTEEDGDTRRTPFNVLSGTSMSCPHVAGVVGLLKKLHPDWSPAAIRSAIMTSARTRDNTNKVMLDGSSSFAAATPFAYGSGHIRPNAAMNPGLVYDLTTIDYLDFLCAIKYSQTMIRQVSGMSYDCPKSANLFDLNYPSMAVPKLSGSATLSRKLKNVGSPGTYRASVREPYGVSVLVEPKVLEFENIGEEKSFRVTLKAKWNNEHTQGYGDYIFGELKWTDGKHLVRSPIAVGADIEVL